MNPVVTTTIGPADPNASPISVNDLIKLLNQLISSEIQGSYIPYVISHDTPGVDDRDKAWIELDTGGRPLAIKIWYAGNAGAWRRIYNGMLGEIRGYSGDPSIDFDLSTQHPGMYTFGKVGGRYDGWHMCNGLDGTPNLSDKFLLGGAMDNVGKDGYSGGWQAAITGPDGTVQAYKTGGDFVKTITEENLPLLTNAREGEDPGLWIHGKQAKPDLDPPHDDMWPLVDTHYANAIQGMNVNITPNAYGKDPPDPFWTTPSFVALAWIVFKGYT